MAVCHGRRGVSTWRRNGSMMCCKTRVPVAAPRKPPILSDATMLAATAAHHQAAGRLGIDKRQAGAAARAPASRTPPPAIGGA
mmetsp:Transcript_59170/g.139511  ORF Transcript_59170/g.139511 Transcript_59170/m.139511 type:complete len:83 (-) Transcript_59170:239-487(-)